MQLSKARNHLLKKKTLFLQMASPARFVLRVGETKSVCHSNIAIALAKESISGSTSIKSV